MELWEVAVAVTAVLVGTILQRISGAGVGITVTPVLVLLIGPVMGVLFTNVITIMSASMIMVSVWSRIDWAQYRRIGPAAIVGAIPAALLTYALSGPWLQILVGAIVLIGMTTLLSVPNLPRRQGTGWSLTAGTIGGFLNTTAGVAAPAMIMYATLTRWEQARFAATLQPIFATMGLVSVVTKVVVGQHSFADFPPWWLLPVVFVTVFLGIRVGSLLSHYVSPARARATAILLAGTGAALAVVRGFVAL